MAMNKHITAIVLCLVLGAMSALHAYVPMVREGVEWGYFCYAEMNDNGTLHKKYYRIQFKGDTIVDNKVFKKAWMYETEKLDTERWPGMSVCMRDEDGVVYRHLKGFKYYDWYIQRVPSYEEYDEQGVIQKIYDFNSLVDSDFIGNVEIDGIQRKEWIHYFPYYEDAGERFPTIEGMGPIVEDKLNSMSGNIVFPLLSAAPNFETPEHTLLYERRVDTGEIVYKSPMYDEFIAGDPTVVGIEGVRADVTERLLVTVDGMTVRSASADTPLTLYRADGSTVATGTGTVTAPSPGIYIVASPGAGTQKVLLH